ncbi:hypothetical protein LRP88_00573 [Fusarium phalaenopsidis]
MASTPRKSTSINNSSPARPVIRLHFKCENTQRMGAFKARGTFHAIERLLQEPGWVKNGGKEKGVVGFGSGNHAQALALAATDKGIKSYIVMPGTTRPNKIAATKGYGAEVIFSGPQFEDREVVAAKVVNDTGARLVPPHDHPDIILGQATAGLEFQQQVKDLDAIFPLAAAEVCFLALLLAARPLIFGFLALSRNSRAQTMGGEDTILAQESQRSAPELSLMG